jgi:hypothetical protein
VYAQLSNASSVRYRQFLPDAIQPSARKVIGNLPRGILGDGIPIAAAFGLKEPTGCNPLISKKWTITIRLPLVCFQDSH